jgi:4-hydroxybenzoate polyprenyltransferase
VIRSPAARFLDYIFILRPTLFYPVWIVFLAGFWGGRRAQTAGKAVLSTTETGILLLGVTLMMGAVFLLNQIADMETDRVNGKLFLLARGIISQRAAYVEALILTLVSWGIAFWLGWRWGLALLALNILSGWLYNYPPARWKDSPLMGMIANGAGGVMLYCFGWTAAGGTPLIPFRVLGYALAGMAVYLNTTLPDIEGDARTGKRTFGVVYGVSRSAELALVLEAGAVAVAAFTVDWLLLIPAVLAFPLFVMGAWKKTVTAALRATKYSVLALAVAVCVAFPWFLVPVVLIFFCSKFYYRWRFQFDYPNLRSR